MIYTFYSYKGGVGRSMALANVAEWLYRKGLRVAIIDWDLEAPGLENFFYSSEEELERVRCQLGLVDVLTSYKRHFSRLPLPPSDLERDPDRGRGRTRRPGDTDAEGSALKDMVALLKENLPPISHALYPIRVGNNGPDGKESALFLLPAGWRSGERFAAYAQAVQSFNWSDFYALYGGEAYFEWLRTQLLDEGFADVVLIDSRTGVTEVGGVCSRQLADIVVAFCVPNIQNLRGTETMLRSFKQDELLRARNGRPLNVVVVPTRVEAGDPEARARFEEEFRRLDLFTPEAFKQSGVRFWDLQVPYDSKYAYRETLAVMDGQDKLATAYGNLAIHLARLASEGSRLRAVLTENIGQQRPQNDMLTLPDPSTIASDDIMVARAAITDKYSSVVAEPRPPFMAPPLPSPFVPRPYELERVIDELIERRHTGTPIVALHGPSGSGKAVLAAAVCHDQRVKETFEDGILWVTLAAESDNLTKLVEGWIFELTGKKPVITSIGDATALLARVLSTRAVLLVIDDVQNAAHLKPFLQGGPRCAHLITIRGSATLPPNSLPPNCIRIDLSTMETQEAVELLGADLPAGHEQELHTTAARLGEQALPFALALANGIIKQQVNVGDTLAGALSYLNRALEPLRGTMQALSASLGLLNEGERDRYRELSIFAEDASIPLGVVKKLWSATGGLDSFETEELCVRLGRMSLLQPTNTRDEVRLHPALRGYLAQQSSNLPDLHQWFLDAYRPPTGWADLPAEEEYLWYNLAYHLIEAGLAGELLSTVKDVRYLAVKAFDRDALAVEQDLLMAEAHRPRDPNLTRDYVLTMLRRNFVNAAHLLSQCETLEDVAGTLHSRIAHQSILAGVASAAEDRLPRPFITARHPLPDLPDPSLSRTLLGHEDTVRGCAISASGSVIVSASDDLTIKLWDTLHGTELVTLTGHTGPVTSCAISEDGARLVSASEDKTLKVWDYDSDNEQATLRATLNGHTATVSDCDISSDKRLIVSASDDTTLKLWEASTGQELQTFTGHEAGVRGCAISDDGSAVISASLDGTLKVWDAASSTAVRTLRGHTAGVRDCAISADGSTAVSASRDYTLKIWNVASGEERLKLEGHTAGVTGCAISAKGDVIVSAGRDGTLKVWDAASGVEIKRLVGHSDWVKDCAISEDGIVIVSASEDRTLKVWNAHREVARPSVSRHATTEMNGLSVSADGALVACASSDKTLTLWDAYSGSERMPPLEGHSAPVLDCAISPTGRFIVSASSDATLGVWDAVTGQLQQTLYGHGGGVRSCGISPDERVIVSGSADRTLMLWDLYTGELLNIFFGHRAGILACAISPHGSRIVSSSDDNTLKVWDAEGGTELMTLVGHAGWVLDCATSLDGRFIASASADHTLKVWDAYSGAELLTLRGHRAGVFGCAFSPDGTRIVSASGDNTLWVWDAFTGDCLATLHVDGRLSACAWSSDGEITAVGNRGVYFLRLAL